MCSYVDLRDRISLVEAVEMIEILATQRENERLAMEAARRKAETERRR